MGPLWRLYRPQRYLSALHILNTFVEPFVERAILQTHLDIEEKERNCEIINFTDSLSRFTKDKKVLRDQLVNTLLAGRDTTAATLTWLFYELSYHPEIYAQLRDEIIKTLGIESKPTYEDLKSMKFLQYCINESKFRFSELCIDGVALRLYPIVPFNMRCALKDTTLPRGGGPQGLDVLPPSSTHTLQQS
jgi:Cytochrome P450